MQDRTKTNGRDLPATPETRPAEAELTHIAIPLAMRDAMVKQLSQFPYGQVSGIINALMVAPQFSNRPKPTVKPPTAVATAGKKPRKRQR